MSRDTGMPTPEPHGSDDPHQTNEHAIGPSLVALALLGYRRLTRRGYS